MSMKEGFKASRENIQEKSKTKFICIALYFNAKKKKACILIMSFFTYIYLFVFLLSFKDSCGR